MARKPKASTAQYGIPHAKFQKTEDGFIVSMNRLGYNIQMAMYALAPISLFLVVMGFITTPNSNQPPSVWPFLLIIGPVVLLAGLYFFTPRTKISVDGTNVTINGNVMNRSDFSCFIVYETQNVQMAKNAVPATFARLGYQFGRRTFPFGPAWSPREADEVSSSLNHELAGVPVAGDQYRSPEALRDVRPTDF